MKSYDGFNSLGKIVIEYRSIGTFVSNYQVDSKVRRLDIPFKKYQGYLGKTDETYELVPKKEDT